jgi:hypothetical protein
MMTLSPSLPAVPTDNALTYALTLLAVAADPNGTRERLDQLVGQITAIHAAVAEYDAAAAKAAEVAAAQEAVTTKAAEVASRGESLLKANTQLSVAKPERARTNA